MSDYMVTYTTEFSGIRVMDRNILPTTWKLTSEVSFYDDDQSTDDSVSNTFMKLDTFFANIVNMSVMYNLDNKWANKAFAHHVFNNIITTPLEPADEILAPLFQSKMNVIALPGVYFETVKLKSDTSAGLTFTFCGNGEEYFPSVTEWLGDKPYYFEHPWWLRDDATTRDARVRTKDKVNQLPPWWI